MSTPFALLFKKPKIQHGLLEQHKTLWEKNQDNKAAKEQYIQTLVDTAKELIDTKQLKQAKTYLTYADELTSKNHHLKILISGYKLQITEEEYSSPNPFSS